MSNWDDYPPDYRLNEVRAILTAIRAGECAALIGLSGSGKSNLLGFMAHRQDLHAPCPRLVLVDCNRLTEITPQGVFQLMHSALGAASGSGTELPGDADTGPSTPDLRVIEARVAQEMKTDQGICFLFDRFEALVEGMGVETGAAIHGNLRALRDAFKYSLTYTTATRRPLDPQTELAELFYANTIWLGPLSGSDARWNVERYARRKGLEWDAATAEAIIRLSGAYPALLRAVCEAHASGTNLDLESMWTHPAVARRMREFWADHPSQQDLQRSNLADNPLLASGRTPDLVDPAQLTAKEHLLWEYFLEHPNRVCEKDELIRAVWPEDRIFEDGIRDDSLAQLIRRLREKIEPIPSSPRYVQTVPGRGYRFSAE